MIRGHGLVSRLLSYLNSHVPHPYMGFVRVAAFAGGLTRRGDARKDRDEFSPLLKRQQVPEIKIVSITEGGAPIQFTPSFPNFEELSRALV